MTDTTGWEACYEVQKDTVERVFGSAEYTVRVNITVTNPEGTKNVWTEFNVPVDSIEPYIKTRVNEYIKATQAKDAAIATLPSGPIELTL